jgi:hypothetical protein
MNRTGRIFIGILWAIGLITGLVLAHAPHLLPLPTPAVMVPLAAGLVLDLLLRSSSQAGRIPPLEMTERAAGVIGGALVAIGASALLAPA